MCKYCCCGWFWYKLRGEGTLSNGRAMARFMAPWTPTSADTVVGACADSMMSTTASRHHSGLLAAALAFAGTADMDALRRRVKEREREGRMADLTSSVVD